MFTTSRELRVRIRRRGNKQVEGGGDGEPAEKWLEMSHFEVLSAAGGAGVDPFVAAGVARDVNNEENRVQKRRLDVYSLVTGPERKSWFNAEVDGS